jgi:hypothetical protein
MGGKLGDFLHSMFAVKQMCRQFDVKSDVYMYDIGWEYGIENTFSELKPIFLAQDYIESFNILYECEIDSVQRPEQNKPIKINNIQLLQDGYTDLGDYIRSPWLYKTCWSEIYSKTFGFDIKNEYSWITWNKTDINFTDKVLIHRRYNPVRINDLFPYQKILEKYGDDVIFVSSNQVDYEKFPYKSIPFVQLKTLDEWFTAINSCRLIVSNLTGPAVIAHALDKPRIIELPDIIDSIHSIGEEKYSKNVNWFIDKNRNTLAW